MLRTIAFMLATGFAMPANAGFIYELSGVITSIAQGETVSEVIQVGDAFRATFEYDNSGAPSPNPFCHDDGAAMSFLFEFEDASITSLGFKNGGCIRRSGTGESFFMGIGNGTGGLAGFGGHDSNVFLDFPSLMFPDDISDATWLDGNISLLLFGPGTAVRYDGGFTQVISRRVPEPSTLALLGVALLTIGFVPRRR